jgi:NADPH:quinone reductase-like Zn-dependent oxidoreductase
MLHANPTTHLLVLFNSRNFETTFLKSRRQHIANVHITSQLVCSRRNSMMASATNTRYLARTQGHKLEPDMAPEPTIAAPNELLIRLKAIAINPADIKMVDEGHRVASWPIVPGLDGAGIVEAVGNEVKAFAVGDEVLAQFMAGPAEKGGGSYQNFAVVQEGMVAKKPEWLSWSEAASIP